MTLLPDDFQFSQASLQDFEDCPRRFQLRYLEGLRWPAVEAEPIEEHEKRMAIGTDFHTMAQRHILGLPEAQIERSAHDPDLLRWWRNLLTYRPVETFGGDPSTAKVRSEVVLQAQVAGYGLVAKYDVVIVNPRCRFVILDWKTSSRRPLDQDLKGRLQTRVYRLLAVEAGGYLNDGEAIDPGSVEMVYWFPEFPDAPVRLPYDASQYESDRRYLERLITEIAGMDEATYALTEDEPRCKYCLYRSYCGRGAEAGELAEAAPEWEATSSLEDLDLDLEQIAEIAF
ncbi:MAG: PD-(D/E)XK nuclease family protein [Anaerolineae bacterium]|nr:PD-(D/E)XK nuclease family protein [Anaerolineae bacterium]